MPTLARLLTLASVLLFTACSQEASTPAAKPEPLLAAGKHTVINYWAEWCKPCREEIPELNKLAKEYADSAKVYGINFDGVSGEALTALAADFGIEYGSKSVADGQRLGITSPAALPTTIIFAPDGSVKANLVGPQTAESLAQYF